MNNKRRVRITEALKLIGQARTILEEVKEEEEACYDNLPEGLQCSERGEKLQENVDQLEDVISNLEDADSLSEM